MSLLLSGGRVVDPSQGLDQKLDLLIERGKVKEVGKITPRKTWEVLSLRNSIVAPGFVDMHVHLREPGREDKETVASGSRAAVAGGFTGIACMPNTEPVNDCGVVTRFIREKARQAGLVHVYPIGAISKGQEGKELAEVGEMVSAGIVAISDDGHPVSNNQLMRRAMEYSRIFDIPVIDHCENTELAAGGCMNEGPVSTRLGLPGISRAAEELDVVRDVVMSRLTGARVHIAHLSTRESLDWVRRAKEQGIAVTCEVTPHHFTLTEDDIRDYDTNYRMNPPLRSREDLKALREGIADGSVDCIASDHAPHTSLEKDTTFEQAANGIVGLETAVALAWNHLVRPGLISPSRLVELFSVNPSRILKLGRATLAPGSPADVTVIDPDASFHVDKDGFRSKSRNTPFHGMVLHGVPVVTIVGGNVVFRR